MDRKPLSVTPLNAMTMKVLGRFRVFCPAHHDDGCDWQGDYSSGENHVEKNCAYEPAPCRFCSLPIIRKEIKAHEDETCERRQLKCEHCQKLVAKPDMDGHVQVECEEVLVVCSEAAQRHQEKKEIGRAVQQECRDRSRMPSSA
eukprot:TRINITY_DN76571_c0_g1_i1.p1 TRINITY_DN76571_c0_g1~~TRINITY_DN76571_c0_g1_i1.p1  ORF type:complete len:153 (-),score=20.38 TRINITY_DN76571_c0_g1_i1:10-441(-)